MTNFKGNFDKKIIDLNGIESPPIFHETWTRITMQFFFSPNFLFKTFERTTDDLDQVYQVKVFLVKEILFDQANFDSTTARYLK